MLIIVNSDDEEASAWAALDVINTLRAETRPLHAMVDDSPWVKTRWANERFL